VGIAAQGGRERFDEIYAAIGALIASQGGAFSAQERAIATDILRRLSKDVEMSIRIALAERLADTSAAPHEIILMLVDDRVEVASPVLARSPLLTDADLVHVVERGSPEHQVQIAQRPNIGEDVSEALVQTDFDAVLSALLCNTSAQIGEETFAGLVERARDRGTLPQLLVQRSDLPPVLARQMCDWVSAELKQALTSRFPQDAGALSRAVDEASSAVQSGEKTSSEISAQKLAAKLAASGQLRPSFLIRVLHQNQIDLFDYGFAALLDMDVAEIRRVLYGDQPVLVAYACRAAGIDRSVFGTVFNLSRHQKGLKTHLTPAQQAEIERIFSKVSKLDALEQAKSLVLS
jgi:uncharacterized protein (DUF2336 family)